MRSTGARTIDFPSGEWADWFTNKTFSGISSQQLTFPLNRFPVFKRRGAIFALNIDHEASWHGFVPLRHNNALTALVHLCDSVLRDRQEIAEWRAPGVVLAYTRDRDAQSLQFTATAHHRPLVVQLRGLTHPEAATVHLKAADAPLAHYVSCDELARATQAREIVAGVCVGDRDHGELLIRINSEHTARGVILRLSGGHVWQ